MPANEVLVRHAMALADADRHPSQWELGAAARAAAADLAERARLRDVRLIVTSPEPKATGTAAAFAEACGIGVVVDDRLVEVRRPWVGDGYRAQAHRYLAGEDLPGWEPRDEVAARVDSAIAAAVQAAGRPSDGEAAGHPDIVVVGHGLALSLHLASSLPPGFDAYGFWCRLAFPDAWRFDRVDGTLERVPRMVAETR